MNTSPTSGSSSTTNTRMRGESSTASTARPERREARSDAWRGRRQTRQRQRAFEEGTPQSARDGAWFRDPEERDRVEAMRQAVTKRVKRRDRVRRDAAVEDDVEGQVHERAHEVRGQQGGVDPPRNRN